jgi:hypothetical protein
MFGASLARSQLRLVAACAPLNDPRYWINRCGELTELMVIALAGVLSGVYG